MNSLSDQDIENIDAVTGNLVAALREQRYCIDNTARFLIRKDIAEAYVRGYKAGGQFGLAALREELGLAAEIVDEFKNLPVI